MMTQPLPEFQKPPVTEVVLGVQFEKLRSLQTPQLGYVWHSFRERFPQTEEQAPLDTVIERFGPQKDRRSTRLELSSVPPCPRLWFLNKSGTELVQVQLDRFIRNWRKQENTDEYPRYRNLRKLFRQDFEAFCALVESEGWGTVEPNQCEVTYVNIIPAGEGWQDHSELDKVLTVFTKRYSDDWLGEPEKATVNLQFVLREGDEPLGRLHIVANAVYHIPTNRPAIRLMLTARGKPEGDGMDGVMRFLDRGHREIVRGFASITKPEMHQVWERTS
ncbi:MAG: TIGR04255 family protein [Planctomycetota bacterium]